MNKICLYCNKSFPKPYTVSKNRWKIYKFCSIKCRGDYFTGRTHTKSHCEKISRGLKGKYTGENNWGWKGGKFKTKFGYILIRQPNHPFSLSNGYIAEHRLIMEKHLGRYLSKSENVHHINGNKEDNRLENLQVLTSQEHGKIPNSGQFIKGQVAYNVKEKIKTFCLICNNPVFTTPSRNKDNRGKYCSRQCSYKAKVGKPTWNKKNS